MASWVVDDFDTVLRHHPLTIGQYAIAMSGEVVPDILPANELNSGAAEGGPAGMEG